LHVIHITPAIARESSGATYAVVRYHQALLSQGAHSRIAALDWPGGPPATDGVHLFPLGVGPRRLGRSPAMFRWLRDRVNDNSPIVLHSHGMWQANAWYACDLSRSMGARVVISPHGTFGRAAFEGGSWIKRPVWLLRQRPNCVRASCFHATAVSEAEEIRERGFKQPVAIVPIGIDSAPPDQQGRPRLKTLLFLGRVHPKKDIPTLLRAWRAVEQQFDEWSLCIAGSDASYYAPSGHLSDVKSLARTLGLTRVMFAGDVHGQAKRELLQNVSLFVLPTKNENFGVAVAEALAHGVPAIVTKGAPWAGLEEHKAGWWIDFGVEPLVHALRQALSSAPEQLAAMGARGREWMIRDFSWDVVGAKMADTYRWLHGQRPKPDWVV
jgi:glycosyltransferase involved in cell wall biosynthesis